MIVTFLKSMFEVLLLLSLYYLFQSNYELVSDNVKFYFVYVSLTLYVSSILLASLFNKNNEKLEELKKTYEKGISIFRNVYMTGTVLPNLP
jgi:hypothetical protein